MLDVAGENGLARSGVSVELRADESRLDAVCTWIFSRTCGEKVESVGSEDSFPFSSLKNSR